MQELRNIYRKAPETGSYQRTQMRKEMVIRRLKERGCRITKQRMMLLDIILEYDVNCCKEIYYQARVRDERIGTATVYRMINTLEEIGAISRKNMYRIACGEVCGAEDVCTVELDDGTSYHLSARSWNDVVAAGLKACGYLDQQAIRSVSVNPCRCEKQNSGQG